MEDRCNDQKRLTNTAVLTFDDARSQWRLPIICAAAFQLIHVNARTGTDGAYWVMRIAGPVPWTSQ
jgi:hypothetical protein